MRIGMVTLCYRPITNGVVQMIDLYRAYLEQLGHEVSIFTFGPPLTRREQDTAVHISPGFPLLNSGYWAHWLMNKRTRQRMREMDILHAHHLFLTIGLARRFGKCPVVFTNHTRYDLYAHQYLPMGRLWADYAMRHIWPRAGAGADAVIVPSASVARVLHRFGVRERVELIENGIDQRPFRTPPAPLSKTQLGFAEVEMILIYIGRLFKEKNVEGLLNQFCRVANARSRVSLLIVGDGPEQKRLEHLARSLKIAGRVRFTGKVAHAAVPNYLAAADLFVTASVSEVHPLALIEAMSSGLPIVAPAAPGNSDIVEHGTTGLLTAGHAALSEAICRLIDNEAERRYMGRQAQQMSARYDIRQTVDKTMLLYEKLLCEQPERNVKRKLMRWSDWSSLPPFQQKG